MTAAILFPALLVAASPPGRLDAARAGRLDARYRRLAEMRPEMSSRSLFGFALDAAAAGYRPERIREVLSLAECMQDRVRENATFGNFRWYWHSDRPQDRNAVEFCMQKGILLWMLYRDRLDAEGRDILARLIRFSVEGIRRHRVRVGYTNIYLMKAWNCIAIGENTDRADLARTGREMLLQWLLYTWQAGVHEYVSPTYYGVDLESLGLIARHARDRVARARAEVGLRLLWADVAANWFGPCDRLGGAHSRDYDYLTGVGYLHRLLPAAGWVQPPAGWQADTFLSLCAWRPPAELVGPIRSAVPRLVQQRWGTEPGQAAVHYVGRQFSLGSAGAAYGPMDKVLSLQFAGGRAMPVVNFLMDARGDPYGKAREPTGGGHRKAFHLVPLVVGVQRGAEVLLLATADPNSPTFRRFAPEPKCLQSHVVIPARVEVHVGRRRIDGNAVVEVPRGGPVFLRFGDVAAGLWVQPGPARLVSDGLKYGVRRLTVVHEATRPTRRATVAVWARAAEGLDEAGFAAFRRAFAGPPVLRRAGARVEASAGPLRVAADIVARRRLAAAGGAPGGAEALLAVNGRDVGREILSAVPEVARYRALMEAVEAGAEGAPRAGEPIEAEAAAMIVPPFRTDADPAASGERFVWMPGPAGGKGGDVGGRAVWLVHVPAAGRYRLSGRVRAPSSSDDSFYVRIRQGGRDVLGRTDWHTGVHRQWGWVDVTAGPARTPLVVTLGKGVATVELACREDGTAVDAIRLTPADSGPAR